MRAFLRPLLTFVRCGFFVHHIIPTRPVLWAGLGATQSAGSPSRKVMEALIVGRPVLWAGLGASLTNVSFGLCYDFGGAVLRFGWKHNQSHNKKNGLTMRAGGVFYSCGHKLCRFSKLTLGNAEVEGLGKCFSYHTTFFPRRSLFLFF